MGEIFVDYEKSAVYVHEDGKLSAEASELGLAPGDWPTTIIIRMREGSLRFVRGSAIRHGPEREFGGYEYDLMEGEERKRNRLVVFND